MADLVVFDLDGTLVDARRNLLVAVQYLRGTMNVEPLVPGCDATFTGNTLNSMLRRAIADREIDEKTALTRMKNFYTANLQQTLRLYPGVEAGLKELHSRHVKLAVWSNKPVKSVNAILEKLQIARYFGDIIGGDGDTPLKPAPDSLLYAMAQLGVTPDEVWYVGDSVVDVQTAHAAGVRCAAVTWGFQDADRLAAECPTLLAHTPQAVWDAVTKA
jgi:phosphoglycolate phosphatase